MLTALLERIASDDPPIQENPCKRRLSAVNSGMCHPSAPKPGSGDSMGNKARRWIRVAPDGVQTTHPPNSHLATSARLRLSHPRALPSANQDPDTGADGCELGKPSSPTRLDMRDSLLCRRLWPRPFVRACLARPSGGRALFLVMLDARATLPPTYVCTTLPITVSAPGVSLARPIFPGSIPYSLPQTACSAGLVDSLVVKK